jgi:acetyltransferase-like isoleucine patch superfamily enzyme
MFLLVKAAIRRYAMSLGMAMLPFSIARVFILRACGVTVGRGCYIGFNVICDTNYPELIRIGENVTISHNCMLITHTGTPTKSNLGNLYKRVAAIDIGDGAWIGANSTVLPGVSVGEDCMIGAGSVVTSSTDPLSLWAGNPCRRIRSLEI